MKLVARWAQVAASEASICQVWAPFWGFVAAGDFARNHRGAQLAFGQIVGSLDAIVIQKGKEMIALFMKPIAHGFFVGFAARRFQ